MNDRRRPKWKTVLVATFILLFVAEVGLVIQQERAQIFAAKAQETGSALIDFAETRAQLLGRKTDESFAPYAQRISTENADTQSLYLKLYSVKVGRLRDGLARRGINSSQLDEFYQTPVSTIAIREIGSTLFDMGSELRTAGIPGTVKKWWRAIHGTHVSPSKFE